VCYAVSVYLFKRTVAALAIRDEGLGSAEVAVRVRASAFPRLRDRSKCCAGGGEEEEEANGQEIDYRWSNLSFLSVSLFLCVFFVAAVHSHLRKKGKK
jgi:hypothetical protein